MPDRDESQRPPGAPSPTAALPTKLFLALDTSGPTARVAILDHAGLPRARAERTAERHSANLLRLCDEVLAAAGCRVPDLAGIACGAGPGSFTGLRVGIAVGKGLALPFDVPFVLVSSLEALATDLARAADDATIAFAPCIDAGKGEIYGQLFDRGAGAGGVSARGPEQRVLPAAYAEQVRSLGAACAVGGIGLDRYADVFAAHLGASTLRLGLSAPSAEAIGRLALARFARGERDSLDDAVPSYGRPPDITRPKPRTPS